MNKNLFKYRLFALLSDWFMPCVILGFFVYVNLPPDGMIYAGGDIFYWFNPEVASGLLFNPWLNLREGYFNMGFSEGIFFYVISKIISTSNQSYLYFFYTSLFLSITYILCRYSLILFVNGLNRWILFALSLSYTISPFVMRNVLMIPNSSSSFYYLYAFFPLLFVLFWKAVANRENENYSILLLGLSSFFLSFFIVNIAFFFSLVFVFIILYLLLSFLVVRSYSFFSSIKIFAALIIPACWVAIPGALGLIAQAFDNAKLAAESNNALPLFGSTFTSNFYGVDNINMMISNTTIFFAVGILMILVGIASIITKKDIGANLLVLVSMLIILIFILTRGVGIISMEVSEFIFSSILFWPFKHPDKFQIFIPFVVTAICASAFNKISASKVKLLFGLIIFQTVAVGYPFFTGNIESKYSLARHNLSWEESNISFHVEVPEDYKNVGEIIKENGGCKGKILGLPYSSITSASWVNYPKWKFFGSDLTAQFFPCPLININNTSLGENYYKSVIEKDITSTDFINQFMIDIRRRSIEYLIYHYDTHRDMIKKQTHLIKMLRKIGLIHKIDDNTHFALYKIDEDLFMPRFNLQNTNFNIGEKEIPLSKIVSIKSFFGYKIKVEGIDNNYYLNFTDTYHPMFLLLPEENILDSIKRVISGMGMIPHSETIYGGSLSNKKNSFGNSWFIDTNNICDDNELACKYSKDIYTMTFNLIFIPSIAIAILFAISIIYLLLLILFSVKNSKQRKLTIQD